VPSIRMRIGLPRRFLFDTIEIPTLVAAALTSRSQDNDNGCAETERDVDARCNSTCPSVGVTKRAEHERTALLRCCERAVCCV